MDTFFNQSLWFTQYTNVYFENCNLQLLTLNFLGNDPIWETDLHVCQSQIGHLYAESGNVVLKNCTSFQAHISSNQSLLSVRNSTMLITSLQTEHFQGGTFLKVVSGNISMTNTQFISSVAHGSLIHGMNASFIKFDNCTFNSNNHSLIALESSSTSIIQNSNFERNTMHSNSIKLHNLIRSRNGVLLLTNSTFVENAVSLGGIVCISVGSIGKIEKCVFTNNHGQGILMVNSLNVLVASCMFHGNSVQKRSTVSLRLFGNFSSAVGTQSKKVTRLFAHKHLDKNIKNVIETVSDTSAKCTVFTCEFVQNTAENGGAISATKMSLVLLKSNFINNSAVGSTLHGKGFGGAVMILKSQINIEHCMFVGNQASAGGAILAHDVSLSVNSSIFLKNQAVKMQSSSGGGGAIHCEQYVSTTKLRISIENSTFHECKATYGGAIKTNVGQMVLKDCVFEGNTAQNGGAVHCVSGEISKIHFVSNKADAVGGALYLMLNSTFRVAHSVFIKNVAGGGGAIFGESHGRVISTFSTFENNTAGSHVAGIHWG